MIVPFWNVSYHRTKSFHILLMIIHFFELHATGKFLFQLAIMGLIGLSMGTTWLACCVQACWGQARQVPQPLDWFAYAGIQVELRWCLVTCMSNAKVIFCVCTLSHALTLAPLEPGSQETADLLVPPEPGREASFACAQPGWGGEPVNQSCEACIWRAWLSCMQQTNQPLCVFVVWLWCWWTHFLLNHGMHQSIFDE